MATAGGRQGSGPERAFVTPLGDAGCVTLDPDESAHLVRSRRVRSGEPVVLFDGAGCTRRGVLREPDPRAAVVEIQGPYPDREPARAVRIASALPEAGRADQLVAALAELGVSTLRPLTFARSPRGRDALPARRGARWARVIREAAKVNGRSAFLAVEPNRGFADWLGDARSSGVLLLDPDPDAAPLTDLLPAEGALPWLVVGPEGGLTDAERAAAAEAGARTVRLGATALRVETAAIAAASVAAAAS